MNICNKRNCNIFEPGIYFIINSKNNKIYIGSGSISIHARFINHYWSLKKDKHKNKHLQNSWNKYKEENFYFYPVINCKKGESLKLEDIYLNKFKNRKKLFNINIKATGGYQFSKETIEKRSISIRNTQNKCVYYKNLIKENKISIEEVPLKFRKYTNFLIDCTNREPWNKGKTYTTKQKGISKPSTENHMRSFRLRSERYAATLNEVYIYEEKNMKFVGKYKNHIDISKISESGVFTEVILNNSRFKKDRRNSPYYILNKDKVSGAIKNKKSYKGLIFSYKPLHEEIHVEKLGKFDEGLTANIELNSEIT